jgi:hypothetical protein
MSTRTHADLRGYVARAVDEGTLTDVDTELEA